MAIIDSELVFYKSTMISDADPAANGGRMSADQVVSGVVQNVWPHVFKAERAAGSTKYRKVWAKVDNDADLKLYGGRIFLDAPTPGDDYVVFFAAGRRDTQADITGSERIYGSAPLKADVAAGANTIQVTCEDASIVGIFQAGDTIRITDKATPDATTGNEEELVIDAVSVAGADVTITTATPLANSYTVAAGGRVSSVLLTGDVQASFDNWVETSTAGTYDEAGSPIVLDNIGTIEETWTLTFTSASTFQVSGDTVGDVGTGDISTDFAPQNPDWSKPYFTLAAVGWGGTWAAGDTIVFQTHPAAVPIWEKRVVPAGASSLSGDQAVMVFAGESL